MSLILTNTIAMALNALINATIKGFFLKVEGMSEAELVDYIAEQEAKTADLDDRMAKH